MFLILLDITYLLCASVLTVGFVVYVLVIEETKPCQCCEIEGGYSRE